MSTPRPNTVVPKSFRVAEWHVEPRLNRISKGEKVHQLEPRIMQVLICLLEHAGEVVTRDQLMETVWAGTYVGEDPLNRAISELRKLFGDAARNPRYIETIRKTGYRFIGPVTTVVQKKSKPSPEVSKVSEVLPEAIKHTWVWISGMGLVVVLAFVWFQTSQPTDVRMLRAQPFTTLAGIEYGPVFSNDGTRIAFTWDGPDESNEDIYVKLLDGEAVQRLTTDEAVDVRPAWSPDDQQIAFTRIQDSTCHIMTMSALGGPARQVASCLPSSYAKTAWSPDGQVIVYVSPVSKNGSLALFALEVSSQAVRQLTHPASFMHGDTHPAFASSGDRLAFVRTTVSGVENIHSMRLDGSDLQALTDENQRISGLSWASDEELLYSSDRDGIFSLWRLLIRGGEPEWLLTGGDGTHRPTVANGVLIYEQRQLDKNIWQLALDESDASSDGPTQLIASTRWDFSPAFSPDGEQVAFASNRTGTYEIWITNRFGLNPVQLTQFNGSVVGKPRWSPDGQYIAFDARSDGHSDIYRVAVAGGLPERITTHPGDDASPTWSADGQGLYFGSTRSGEWQIWRMVADGSNEPQQLTREGGFTAFESPDGNQLFFAHEDRDGIWQQPMDGGAATLVVSSLLARDWSNWALQEDGIYFVDRTMDGRVHLAFYRFADGLVTLLQPLAQRTTNPGIAIAPDGRSLLFARIDQYESDLMRVDDFQ